MILDYKVRFFKLKNREEIVSFVVTIRSNEYVLIYPFKTVNLIGQDSEHQSTLALVPMIPVDRGEEIIIPKTEILFSVEVDEVVKNTYYIRVRDLINLNVKLRNELYDAKEKDYQEKLKTLH